MAQFVLLVRTTAAGIEDGLRQLAEVTDDPRLKRAVRMLDKPVGGRPAVHDARLITDALHLIETGEAPNLNQALLRVARTVSGRQSEKSIAERLRRKIKNLPAKEV